MLISRGGGVEISIFLFPGGGGGGTNACLIKNTFDVYSQF